MKTERLPIIDLIAAQMIYDYTPDAGPVIPDRLLPDGDKPYEQIGEAGQFQGTPAEKLAEIAGRACYDSFGRGRTSESFHAHILEVKHGSVYEHFNFTVELHVEDIEVLASYLRVLINRPGVWVRIIPGGESTETRWKVSRGNGKELRSLSYCLQITLNMRAAVEWHFWTRQSETAEDKGQLHSACGLGGAIRAVANEIAPHVIVETEEDGWGRCGSASDIVKDTSLPRLVAPETDEEKWITMLLTGSRGFSHELVRHGDRTAISQRSTRYVDENESPWVWHPLIMQWIGDTVSNGYSEEEAYAELGLHVEEECKKTYGKIVERLQPWMKEKLIEASGGRENMDKSQVRNIGFSARKQARGAARGFLGNALYTEVVFSASVAQWNRILRQRAGGPADAEIRESFAEKVLPLLQSSQYGDSFAQWELFDCEDGIGKAAREIR